MPYIIQPTEVWEAALRLDGCAGQCKDARTKVAELYPQWFAHGRVIVFHDIQRCTAARQVGVARRVLSGLDTAVEWSRKNPATPIGDIQKVIERYAHQH